MNNFSVDYLYDEFRISLIVLSLPANRQFEIAGYGCVGDEMLIDFDTYCIRNINILKEHGLITEIQIDLLNEFSKYLKKFDKRDEDFYWNRNTIETHPDWEELRVQSRILLSKLFNKQFDIQITKEDSSYNGTRVERMVRKLVVFE